MKIKDKVNYKGNIGIIIKEKQIYNPSFLKDYMLFYIQFTNDIASEWINEMYLTKV